MNKDIDTLRERFERSQFILMKHLGPEIMHRAQLGLTPSQFFMLYFIRRESRCSVSKLAEKMEVAPSAITVMLDRLENHGYVSRTRDTDDRRVVIVELTTAGEEKLNQVLDVRKQIMQHCLTQIDSRELESFIKTLESLASIAQGMDVEEIVGIQEKER